MAGFAAAFNGLRTIMDRRSILDGGRARLWRDAGDGVCGDASENSATRPRLLCGPIDEGVDCLAADGPAAAVHSRISNQPEISGVHPSVPTNRRRQPLVRGSLHAAGAIDRLRRREAACRQRCVPLRLPGIIHERPSSKPIDRPAARKTPIWSLSSSDRCGIGSRNNLIRS